MISREGFSYAHWIFPEMIHFYSVEGPESNCQNRFCEWAPIRELEAAKVLKKTILGMGRTMKFQYRKWTPPNPDVIFHRPMPRMVYFQTFVPSSSRTGAHSEKRLGQFKKLSRNCKNELFRGKSYVHS